MAFLLAAALVSASPASPAAQQDRHAHAAAVSGSPSEGGQAAFAAIGEAVALLKADPRTDWSQVNVDALREHLLDMDEVTLRARVVGTPVPRGMRFHISGEGRTRESIRRMVRMHAHAEDMGAAGRGAIADAPDGIVLTLTAADESGAARIRALGLFGWLADGAHHQAHHLAIAAGRMHH